MTCDMPELPLPPCHHDARGWLREVWRLDRSPTLEPTQMRLLQLSAGERRGLYTLVHHPASLTLCCGDVRLFVTETDRRATQQRTLVTGQTVVLPAGTRWGLCADSDAILLCALAGDADAQVDWVCLP